MKKVILTVLGGLLLFSVSGCGTVKGVGEDVSTVGHWFMKGSDNVKDNMAKDKSVK